MDRAETQTRAVLLEEQRDALLRHYEEAATAVGSWSNQIPTAIREWYERRAALRSPQEEAGGERRAVVEANGRDADFWYESYRGVADAVEKHLAAYIIDDDVAEESIYEEAIEAAGAALARSPGGTDIEFGAGRVLLTPVRYDDGRIGLTIRDGEGSGVVGEVLDEPPPGTRLPFAANQTRLVFASPESIRVLIAALEDLAAPAGAESSPEATDQGEP